MKRKLFLKILLFVPLLAFVAGVNFYYDIAHVFNSKSYLKKVVDILHRGENVTGLENYDERLLQKEFISNMKTKREVGVLGTSRAMGIGAEEWGNQDIYNSAVSSAILHDLVAITHLYDENQLLPDTMIILAEYQYVNPNYESDRWMSLSEEYNEMIEKLDLLAHKAPIWTPWKFEIQKGKTLFDNKFFWKALKGKKRLIQSTELKSGDEATKLANGALRYGSHHTTRDIADINARARAYNHDAWHLYKRFQKADPKMLKLFESLVLYLQEKGVVVVFFISPLHPFVFDNIQAKNKHQILEQTETYFLQFAQRRKIEVLGSYNPGPWGFAGSDFYDGLHLKPGAVKKILQTRKRK